MRLIDVGCVRVVDVNQLLTLPADLLAIPAQAVEACICGIKPCDDDMDWPLQVRAMDHAHGTHAQPEDKIWLTSQLIMSIVIRSEREANAYLLCGSS